GWRRARQRDVRELDRNDEDRTAQPPALALRRRAPRRGLRMDRDVVQPPPQALQPRLPLTPRIRKPTSRRTHDHQALTCPTRRGNLTTTAITASTLASLFRYHAVWSADDHPVRL